MATKEEPEQDIWKIIKKADARMYENKLMEDKNRKNNIIKELLNRLQEQSGENLLHTMHMQKLAFELGSAIDLSFYELNRLALLVTLHDIGKVTIPARILTKPDSLTNREWQSIKDHPKTGYRIASATKEFAHIAQEILYHHEHWGGSGYPEGLRGSKIPLLSRIVAIVDAYEVMSSGRPYKEAITKDECKQELIEKAGTQFDPKLVDIFVELLE